MHAEHFLTAQDRTLGPKSCVGRRRDSAIISHGRLGANI